MVSFSFRKILEYSLTHCKS